mgnify:CR=1 FL=1
MVVVHRHKTHKNPRQAKIPIEMRDKVIRTMKMYVESDMVVSYTKGAVIKKCMDKFPDMQYGTLSGIYDYVVNAEYVRDRSDFRSSIKFCKAHEDDYAYFVFHSDKNVEIAIMMKKVMKKLSTAKRIECVAIDATYNISQHKCEMFVANATVDRTGIPFGYMFVKSKFAVCESLKRVGYTVNCFPLPQCSVASDIT